MTEPSKWRQEQLDKARELLDSGQQAFAHGDIRSADAAVDEALVILDMAEAEGSGDDVRRLRVRGLNDRGLFYQHLDEPDEARPLHHRAAEILEQIEDLDGDEFLTTAVAVYLNLGQIGIFDENIATARDATERGIEIAEDLVERSVRGAQSLALGLYQNQSAVESHDGDFDAAADAAEKALDLAESVADQGNPAAIGQAARICQQLSVQLFEADQYDDALEWGRRAEELSERTYNELGEQALHIYVVSQINLISYYEELHRFADAEDCLWKAIDVAGSDPEILERGQMFYEECRKQSDARLEKGNLPRDEVDMGYEDLREVMEDAGL